MSAVFKKLNLKDQTEIVVLGGPASFEPEIAALRGVTVRRSLGDIRAVTFALAFVVRQPDVDELASSLTSRAGFEPVRMVAIDADWSAVRFRRVENIKTMTRPASYAMTAAGKAKSAAGAAKATRKAPTAKRPGKRR